jgi:hypothetical protein
MKRLAFALTFMAPAQAGAFDLSLPLKCDLGETCFIQQYMDHDAGPNAQDFTCGPLSYDTHSGTDFALPSDSAMQAGVAVLASAAGVVKGARDGMPDIRVSDPKAPPLEGRDCGNGVLVEHEGGWQTQYCHMKQGSITVRPGDPVTVGSQLGLVGLSGNTEFPHLHLSVRRDGKEVDPFAPDAPITCGVEPDQTLWAEPIPYVPGGIIGLGFSTAVPEFSAIKAGLPAEAMTVDAPALVIWAYYFGNRAGDSLDLRVIGPGGEVVAQTITLDRTQAQAFRAIGKKRGAAPWPAGNYMAFVTLSRDGTVLDTAEQTLTLR